jgi:hypothetical protein
MPPDEKVLVAVKQIVEEMAWKRIQHLPEDKREAAFFKACDALMAELLEEN